MIRFTTMEKERLDKKIRDFQKELDKAHIKFNVSKTLRYKNLQADTRLECECLDGFVKAVARIPQNMQKRFILKLSEVVALCQYEYYTINSINLVLDNNQLEIADEVDIKNFIPYSQLNNWSIELNTESEYFRVRVEKWQGKVRVLCCGCESTEKANTYFAMIYDPVTGSYQKDIGPDGLRDIKNAKSLLTVNNNSGGKTSHIFQIFIISLLKASLKAMKDYTKTMEEAKTIKRPGTVDKRITKSKRNDVTVIERDEVTNKDVYIKLSTLAKRCVATGTGTKHESHKSPCEHYRRGYTRVTKTGKVITVKPCVVNSGSAVKVNRIVVMDK